MGKVAFATRDQHSESQSGASVLVRKRNSKHYLEHRNGEVMRRIEEIKMRSRHVSIYLQCSALIQLFVGNKLVNRLVNDIRLF